MNFKVIMVYVFCLVESKYEDKARRFVESYLKFPGLYPHQLWVVCNGAPANSLVRDIFKDVPCLFIEWDDSGWDIGSYKAVASVIMDCKIPCDFMICCGGDTHFRRAGWLKRMAEAWEKHGPGLYGASASYEQRPHIQTTSFCCPPELIHSYPYPLITKEDRYNFEWGRNSILTRAERRGLPCLMVTWDGEWNKDKWRKPANIFRKGDQSNLLAYYLATETFESKNSEDRKRQSQLADGLWNAEPGMISWRTCIDNTFTSYDDATEQEELHLMDRCLLK